MADVFISYHEASAGDIAAKIAAALENAGISCWYAKRDIPPGGDFARYIPPQIDACKVFLLILNDRAVYQSHHIENELGLAFGRFNRGEEITILPLEIGSFKQETWIKYYLIHTQSVKIPLLDNTQAQEVTRKIVNILGKEPQQNQETSIKTCFLISRIGKRESEVRALADKVRSFLRYEVLVGDCAYDLARADELYVYGDITNAMLQHVMEDELVIVLMDYMSESVTYGMATRHFTGKACLAIASDKFPRNAFDARDIVITFPYDEMMSYVIGGNATNKLLDFAKKLREAIKMCVNNKHEDSNPITRAKRSLRE